MEKKSRMKIGLFGGTFNPIHIGHLRAAEELREILQLEKVYFILGSELFSEIDSWKEYNKLFELTHFAGITRPGFSKNLLPSLPLALKDDFIYHSDEHNLIVYLHKTSKTLALVQIEGIQVSSTQIRDLIYKNKSIKYLVPREVERYIFDHNLYKKEAPR